jgi:hypothetical protein
LILDWTLPCWTGSQTAFTSGSFTAARVHMCGLRCGAFWTSSSPGIYSHRRRDLSDRVRSHVLSLVGLIGSIKEQAPRYESWHPASPEECGDSRTFDCKSLSHDQSPMSEPLGMHNPAGGLAINQLMKMKARGFITLEQFQFRARQLAQFLPAGACLLGPQRHL